MIIHDHKLSQKQERQTERAEPCSEGTEQTERGRGVDNREIINETLVHLFHEIQKLEEEAIITEDFKDLTNNDMHIIEAVGLEGGNMSSIAAKLDITVGSLTTSMNSLVKKGYTERERSEKDRRIVYIHLTGKGRQAFHHHAKFHEQMTDAVMAELGEEEVQVLGKTLKALTDFFRSYKKIETKRLLQPGQNQKNLSGMQKPFLWKRIEKCYFSTPFFLTDIREHTPFTVRCRPRSTDLASVLHKPVAERASFFRRHNFPECHLHLLRILAVMHEPDAVAQPDAVRIRHNRRLFEYIAHNQVRTFPSHARELQKCVKVIRHLAVVLVAQHAHAGVDVACLALSKTARPHNFFDFLRCRVCQRIDIRILCVEILHRNIDPRIGALCGQADTDEQLPRLVIVKRTVGVRDILVSNVQ